ncbi:MULTISPECIES: co-regulatory protein PtrA N-terminal domain-containing protein [Pseudomonas]|uniref:co-regulatory protein PtrA N-terminal domain-containing protein n=1 Tax=Pseudomonas juntendi TaxID=2666183 RepID=UPI002949BD22|nr:co-regulatory protein PtrA N-terminal domain-containing protein [Pseudomonas juntendi]MDV5388617.1 co-regulatory protein PtrA N-terminal domain-containing protein [Pseudomonas juntendi]
MKYLRLLLIVGATLLSSTVWAEGGSDRALERIASMRDKADATLVAETVKQIEGRVEAQPGCPPAK